MEFAPIKTYCPTKLTQVGNYKDIDIEAVKLESPNIQLVCRNFNRGVCMLLEKPCPLNAASEVHVEMSSALFKIGKLPVSDEAVSIPARQTIRELSRQIKLGIVREPLSAGSYNDFKDSAEKAGFCV